MNNDDLPAGAWALAVVLWIVVMVATIAVVGWVSMLLLGVMGLSVSFAQAAAGSALAVIVLSVIKGGLKK